MVYFTLNMLKEENDHLSRQMHLNLPFYDENS